MDKTNRFCAEWIFDGHTFHRNASIDFHQDGSVLAVPQANANMRDPFLPGLIMPAFINTHCHLELSHLKGQVPKHTGLVDFLLHVNTRREHDEAFIQQQMQLAEQEMWRQGIVAVGDISNTLDSLSIKKNKRLHYHTFVETFGLSEEHALQRFNHSASIFEAFHLQGNASLVLHAPYSLSESLIRFVDDFNQNRISTLHNQECDAENEFIQHGIGDFMRLTEHILPNYKAVAKRKRSLQYMLDQLIHTHNLILVHNTVTNKYDVEHALQNSKKLFWCLCPNANLYIENKLPDVLMLQNEGCQLTIGTDSLASNVGLSIWNELCTLKHHFPTLDWQDLLRWATLNGAEALKMDQQVGSLHPGKKPGLLHLPQFDPTTIPSYDTPIHWLVEA
jgi:cytosine/adenosine deaminase-related metal-dependent hydrolase